MNSIARKTAVFVLVMGVVALGGWFGRKAYKKSVERRLLTEAKGYLSKKDIRNTALCLRRALQVNPYSLNASVMMADMLEQMRVPAAIAWRSRAAQLVLKDPELRLAWAETALKFQNFVSAKSALDGLDDHTKSGAAYDKLAGALAWETGQPSEAEKWYQQALRLEPTNHTIAFNLATIHLVSTNTTVSDAARVSLERMTTNAEFKLRALHYLKTDAVAHKELSHALGYSWSIVRDPGVTLGDRVDHLQLLRATKSAEFESWRSGLESEARRLPATAFALGQWLLTTEGPTNALSWLKNLPPNVQTNQPVPLLMADCYLFLEDWNGLLALVQHQDWGEGNCFRLALEARAQQAKNELRASQTAWTKAVSLAAHDLDKLVRLTQLSAKWGWSSEHIDLLRRITSEFPNQHWAADGLIAELYALGNSRGLADFLSKSLESNPTNAKLKNNLAAVSLLRKSGLETAYRLAREAYNSSPENPFFMSTYAYALLLQNKTNDAEKIVSEIKPEYRKIPSIAAYYGVVEAEAGHKDEAREALQRAESAPLLPEEKEMVRLASSHL